MYTVGLVYWEVAYQTRAFYTMPSTEEVKEAVRNGARPALLSNPFFRQYRASQIQAQQSFYADSEATLPKIVDVIPLLWCKKPAERLSSQALEARMQQDHDFVLPEFS